MNWMRLAAIGSLIGIVAGLAGSAGGMAMKTGIDENRLDTTEQRSLDNEKAIQEITTSLTSIKTDLRWIVKQMGGPNDG